MSQAKPSNPKPIWQATRQDKHATKTSRYDPTPRLRGQRWVDQRKLLLMQNPLCVKCKEEGRVTLATEIDHIVPLFKGGAHESANLQALCADHHREKTAIDMDYKPVRRVGADGVPEGWV